MSFLGLTLDKLLIIGLLAVLLIGPERLPQYAERLAQLARGVRDMASGARDRMRDEMGPEFDDVDWRRLDPRQYDPRRIVREALLDDPAPAAAAPKPAAKPSAAPRPAAEPGAAPFDDEAT